MYLVKNHLPKSIYLKFICVIINTSQRKEMCMKITGTKLGTTLIVAFFALMITCPVNAEKSDERLIRESSKTYTGATRIINGKSVKYPRHYSLHTHNKRGNTMVHMGSNAVPYYTGYARHTIHTEVKYLKDDIDDVADTMIKVLVIKELLK